MAAADHVRVRAAPLDPERDADVPRGIFLVNGDGIVVMSIGGDCAVHVSLSLAAAIEFAALLLRRIGEAQKAPAASARRGPAIVTH